MIPPPDNAPALCTNCRTDKATVPGVGGEDLCEICAHCLTCEVCTFETPMECRRYRVLMRLAETVYVRSPGEEGEPE